MATKTPITDALAKELGYKDSKELKKVMKETGSVRQRVESGQGFREAIAGSIGEKTTEIKQTFTKKGMKKLGRQAYKSVFAGDDLLSAYMRGRIVKKEKKELEEAGIKEGEPEKESGGGDSAFTRVIAKESMMLPGMARDMNVMRQNIQKLVKLWSSPADIEAAKGKPYVQGADDFFMRSDQAEAELEAARSKGKDKKTSPTPEKEKEKEGGLLDTIMNFFSGGFMNAIKSLFSPKMLMKVFSKVFLPIVIIGTLFSGIMDGFKKYQETGSFSEAIIAGLGGMLSFLTFGIFGEDTIRNLFDSVSSFFKPITDTISEIFTGIKDFFVKLFGGQVKVEDKTPAKMAEVKPSDKGMDAAKLGENAAKAGGESDQKSKDIGALFGKVQKGDAEGLMKGAQEFSQKYPQSATSTETTPTPVSQKAPEPTPTPVTAPKAEAKIVEKIGGEQIKLPSGVILDPNSGHYEYKGIRFSANNQKELNMLVDAVDQKKIVEYQTTDRNAGNVTKTFDGATGEMSLAPPKTAKVSPVSSEPSTPVSSGSSAGSGGGGSVSTGGSSASGSAMSAGGGGSDIGASPSAPSGESISSTSSDVAESQRMESAADQGTIVNAPTTNNSSSSKKGNDKAKAADVYDSDLASMLITT